MAFFGLNKTWLCATRSHQRDDGAPGIKSRCRTYALFATYIIIIANHSVLIGHWIKTCRWYLRRQRTSKTERDLRGCKIDTTPHISVGYGRRRITKRWVVRHPQGAFHNTKQNRELIALHRIVENHGPVVQSVTAEGSQPTGSGFETRTGNFNQHDKIKNIKTCLLLRRRKNVPYLVQLVRAVGSRPATTDQT